MGLKHMAVIRGCWAFKSLEQQVQFYRIRDSIFIAAISDKNDTIMRLQPIFYWLKTTH
tara:strand:+ start:551 stop:724 length:174 start_codon:yes stop_codon:yes gene_type:complete